MKRTSFLLIFLLYDQTSLNAEKTIDTDALQIPPIPLIPELLNPVNVAPALLGNIGAQIGKGVSDLITSTNRQIQQGNQTPSSGPAGAEKAGDRVRAPLPISDLQSRDSEEDPEKNSRSIRRYGSRQRRPGGENGSGGPPSNGAGRDQGQTGDDDTVERRPRPNRRRGRRPMTSTLHPQHFSTSSPHNHYDWDDDINDDDDDDDDDDEYDGCNCEARWRRRQNWLKRNSRRQTWDEQLPVMPKGEREASPFAGGVQAISEITPAPLPWSSLGGGIARSTPAPTDDGADDDDDYDYEDDDEDDTAQPQLTTTTTRASTTRRRRRRPRPRPRPRPPLDEEGMDGPGEEEDNHQALIRTLMSKGLPENPARVVTLALGQDEVNHLPPQFIRNLVTGLLHIEASFKKAQFRLAGLNAAAQYIITSALPAEQAAIGVNVSVVLGPFGTLFGVAAAVKRMSQALSMYYQQELAAPFRWALPNNMLLAIPDITALQTQLFPDNPN